MVCHSRSIFSDSVRVSEVAEHWVRKTSYMLNKAMKYRQDNQGESFIDIRYDLLLNDSIKQLSGIYEGSEGITDELKQKFMISESQNPQGKYGKHTYSPEDFGLTREELIHKNRTYHQLLISLP